MLVLVYAGAALPTGSRPARVPSVPPDARMARVEINENRKTAGTLRGNVLTLHLVARVGMWYPDGDAAPGTPVQAFGEEGHAPLIPGPMIRVRAGTEVALTLRNAVANSTLIVHGLTSRGMGSPAARDSIQLSSGASRTLHIRLDAPGTYYYWGTTMGRPIGERTREDAQLTGAIIVDPMDGPPVADRVMVIGMWADTAGHWLRVRTRMLAVMNGRSWPRTERLGYTIGDTVHWRLINASADAHPMHLHGFYFRVDSRGDGISDTVYGRDARDEVVTDLMRAGTTMTMTWSPNRTGNWLFHCHLNEHFAHRGSLGMPPPRAMDVAQGAMNHALGGMGGLVMGVTVHAARGHRASPAVEGASRRQMRLVIRANASGSAAAPNFAYVLEDGRASPAPIGSDLPAPPLVLTRGEPVSITVVNTLAEPTAVHWHGIELESYFDGVPGFSGTARRLSPVIAPGDSFVARFTPPRSGTFIYHTHVDEERQQRAGLAGPIIVLDAREAFDPARDLSVVAGAQRTSSDSTGNLPRLAWLNGSGSPAPFNLKAGVRYRIRFINMTTAVPLLRFELAQDGKPVRWRPIAKDGADLPETRQVMRDARQPVSIGETLDVEFNPERAGDARITAHLGNGTVIGSLPVHISAAESGKP